MTPETELPRFPKPYQIQRRSEGEAVKVFPDGREVCNQKNLAGRREYDRRRNDMWGRQFGICGLQNNSQCPVDVPRDKATFEHTGGRGSGGFKRDDRIVIDGKPHNLMACIFCNSENGSGRK